MGDDLQSLDGCGPKTASKLEDGGITTFMSLAVSSPGQVGEVSGLSEAKARKLIKKAREKVKLGFEVASEYSKKRDLVKKIPTGCTGLDNILGGGFESGTITEVYGQFGTGKTQLAHWMVTKALEENEDNKAMFLDTENTFRPDRIEDFAKSIGLDIDDVMNRIFVARAYNSDHQMLLADEIENILQKDGTYRILVVDSLTSHFRSEYIGRGELASRQQKLNKHMHQLLKIADLYNMVVIVTNQVVSDPGQFYGDPTKPIGGNIVGHNSTFRIYMRPGKKGSIYSEMVDSPNLPKNSCNFFIREEGFEDA